MKVVFLGRYNLDVILPGPDKVARRVFDTYCQTDKSVFIEYFFDGTKFGYKEKLFGKETVLEDGNKKVLKLGLIPFIIFLFSYKPDVIHIITFERFALLAFLWKFLSSCKVIFTMHGVVSYEDKNFRPAKKFHLLKNIFAEELYINLSDKVTVFSEYMLELTRNFFSASPQKFFIVDNGCDEIFLSEERKYKVEKDIPLTIAFISDPSRPEKGFKFLAETLEMVDCDLELFVVGDKDFFSGIKNPHIKVNYLAFMQLEDYSEFCSQIDVIISSSLYDPFPITVIEAAGAGMVPIITSVNGLSRYIVNDVNGYIVNYGDSIRLSLIIEYLFHNRQLIEEKSKNVRKLIGKFTWENITQNYIKLYLK